jgi:hypothetical protein
MQSVNRISSVVKNRPVFLFNHGSSISELEYHIQEVKDKDICYVSTGLFPIMEQNILSKIGKPLDIVFDCATVPHARVVHYERIRLGRIHEFLNRPQDNLWITTHGLIRDSVKPLMPDLLTDWYKDKIALVDGIFPQDEIPRWMDVPNSTCLAIASMIAGGASKIITFGLDGYSGDPSIGVNSYYKPEEHRKERKAALGTEEDPGINRDTGGFFGRFPQLLVEYRELFRNHCEIYNCSPKSIYDVPQKITYNELSSLI